MRTGAGAGANSTGALSNRPVSGLAHHENLALAFGNGSQRFQNRAGLEAGVKGVTRIGLPAGGVLPAAAGIDTGVSGDGEDSGSKEFARAVAVTGAMDAKPAPLSQVVYKLRFPGECKEDAGVDGAEPGEESIGGGKIGGMVTAYQDRQPLNDIEFAGLWIRRGHG